MFLFLPKVLRSHAHEFYHGLGIDWLAVYNIFFSSLHKGASARTWHGSALCSQAALFLSLQLSTWGPLSQAGV